MISGSRATGPICHAAYYLAEIDWKAVPEGATPDKEPIRPGRTVAQDRDLKKY